MYIVKTVTSTVGKPNSENIVLTFKDLLNLDASSYVPDFTISANAARDLMEMLKLALDGTNKFVVTDEELDLVRTKGKVSAVVAYRARTGRGLKEAKDAVEEAMAEFGVRLANNYQQTPSKDQDVTTQYVDAQQPLRHEDIPSVARSLLYISNLGD